MESWTWWSSEVNIILINGSSEASITLLITLKCWDQELVGLPAEWVVYVTSQLLSGHDIITFISRIGEYEDVSELVVGSAKIKNRMVSEAPVRLKLTTTANICILRCYLCEMMGDKKKQVFSSLATRRIDLGTWSCLQRWPCLLSPKNTNIQKTPWKIRTDNAQVIELVYIDANGTTFWN